MKNTLLEVWKECNSPAEYFIAMWITLLTGVAIVGLGKVLFELVTNYEQFNNLTFGLIDYI